MYFEVHAQIETVYKMSGFAYPWVDPLCKRIPHTLASWRSLLTPALHLALSPRHNLFALTCLRTKLPQMTTHFVQKCWLSVSLLLYNQGTLQNILQLDTTFILPCKIHIQWMTKRHGKTAWSPVRLLLNILLTFQKHHLTPLDQQHYPQLACQRH